MAVWDAQHHIPARLTADFGADERDWHIGVQYGESAGLRRRWQSGFLTSPGISFRLIGSKPTSKRQSLMTAMGR